MMISVRTFLIVAATVLACGTIAAQAQVSCNYNPSSISNAATVTDVIQPATVCRAAQAPSSTCSVDCAYGYSRGGAAQLACGATSGTFTGTTTCTKTAFVPVNMSAVAGDSVPATSFRGDATYPASVSRGLLSLYYTDAWGTVCSSGLDLNNDAATAACKQLGWHLRVPQGKVFQPSNIALASATAGAAMPILLDDVACTGTEANLDQCAHAPWRTSRCVHAEDAAVDCFDTVTRTMTMKGLPTGSLFGGDVINGLQIVVSPPIMDGVGALDIFMDCGAGGGAASANFVVPEGSTTSNLVSYTAPLTGVNGAISCELQLASGDPRAHRLSRVSLTQVMPSFSVVLTSGGSVVTNGVIASASVNSVKVTVNSPIRTTALVLSAACNYNNAAYGTLGSSTMTLPVGSTSGTVAFTAPKTATTVTAVQCTFKTVSGDARYFIAPLVVQFDILGDGVLPSTDGSDEDDGNNPEDSTGGGEDPSDPNASTGGDGVASSSSGSSNVGGGGGDNTDGGAKSDETAGASSSSSSSSVLIVAASIILALML